MGRGAGGWVGCPPLREVGPGADHRPDIYHQPRHPPFSTSNHANVPRYFFRPQNPPQKDCAPWSAFHLDWPTVFTLCTYKSRPPTLFALPTSLPPTSHLFSSFPSCHSIPKTSFIVHHRPLQPHSTTHRRPQSFCSHHHLYPPSLPIFSFNYQHHHNGHGTTARHPNISHARHHGELGAWAFQSRLSETFGT